jgi:hypothetical protein
VIIATLPTISPTESPPLFCNALGNAIILPSCAAIYSRVTERDSQPAKGSNVEQLDFKVKGSTSGTYEITFIKDGDSLTALCNCPAGTFGNSCKHRVAILAGKTDSIASDNADRVPTVVEWLAGTDVEAALEKLSEAEKIKGFPKDELAALKKKLARAMNS